MMAIRKLAWEMQRAQFGRIEAAKNTETEKTSIQDVDFHNAIALPLLRINKTIKLLSITSRVLHKVEREIYYCFPRGGKKLLHLTEQ
jgi:hypothetical protein